MSVRERGCDINYYQAYTTVFLTKFKSGCSELGLPITGVRGVWGMTGVSGVSGVKGCE